MLEIAAGQYLSVTPYGAHYAVASATPDPFRGLLFALMNQPRSPLLTEQAACAWCATPNVQHALSCLHRLQSMAMVQGAPTPTEAPSGPLEQILPPLLPALSEHGKSLLADAQGFYLAVAGFRHETAEELAALSADISTLHARHSRLITNNLGIGEANWAVVDVAGESQIGIWPLHVSGQRFSLVIAGRPRLYQADFARLVWALHQRYGA